jgi:hypothetical protein
MATKQNITEDSHFPLCTTITHRIILPFIFSISFILCYSVPFDGKNVIHTVNSPNADGYVNSYRSKEGVSKSPKLKIKTRSERLRVRHI